MSTTINPADAAAEYLLGDRPRRHTARTASVARKVERATRKQEALSMRLAGVRTDQIAAALHVHPSTVRAWVADAIADIPREEADQLRLLELVRLDALQRAVWADAMRGETRAVDRALAVMDRRARYLGLYEASEEGLAHVGTLLDRLIGGEG